MSTEGTLLELLVPLDNYAKASVDGKNGMGSTNMIKAELTV